MNRKNLVHLVSFCVAMIFLTGSVYGQITVVGDYDVTNKRVGTAGAAELLIPVGARGLAMSGATIATTEGINSIFYNVGGLGRFGTTAEGMFSSMAYIADINVNYAAVGIKFGSFGVIGLSIKSINFGDIAITSAVDPEGIAGRTFSPTFVTAGLSYARSFTDAITAGFTLKLITENLHRITGSGVAIDLGIQYRGVAGIEGVNLGVVLKNVGPQIKFDGPGLLRKATADEGRRPTQYYASLAANAELPTSIELGLGYDYSFSEELSFNVNGVYANNSLAIDGYRMGGEAVFDLEQLRFAGRGGMELFSLGADDENIYGPTFGFGITWMNPSVNMTLDYAYRSVDYFTNNSMFSLTFAF